MTSTNGDYYLVVPYKTTQGETENQGRVVALDPGVRTVLMQSLMGETTAVAHGLFAFAFGVAYGQAWPTAKLP
ncbi:hypothetical protein [Moorea producens]|uniref:hypothetical protein n=1 Tax=Moorena producens TaxID=1155739 RepID=UPI0009F25DA9